jgi:hypothetical protein
VSALTAGGPAYEARVLDQHDRMRPSGADRGSSTRR